MILTYYFFLIYMEESFEVLILYMKAVSICKK
uniref:Uncharacterized protein n=1 Tax=Siphoviridae sp. ctlzn3 TaxID=2826450 RepID=A0A8S5N6V1_9CAUD|nr:MAG TPA: hypothetical protein [Siphoviridae sp. ctlzn3]